MNSASQSVSRSRGFHCCSAPKERKADDIQEGNMPDTVWLGKPYYSLDAWCKENYHYKCYKVALNAHMTCPNRDGSLDTRGCIFCSRGGSGDFATDLQEQDVALQLKEGLNRISAKFSANQNSPCVIAYFQAYTNTYAPLPYLRNIFSGALATPSVCGISIATRPDCIPEDVLQLLTELKAQYPEKFIWIELGLQTIHPKTADFIRRGYELSCFEDAMSRLKKTKLPVIIHMILFLPGEDRTKMLQTLRYINKLSPFGIKLQLLHVLKETDLARYYFDGVFNLPTKEEYLDVLVECLENLSPDIVVHRVTGDGPKNLLIAPLWSSNKKDVLNSLHGLMREKGARQGRLYTPCEPDL